MTIKLNLQRPASTDQAAADQPGARRSWWRPSSDLRVWAGLCWVYKVQLWHCVRLLDADDLCSGFVTSPSSSLCSISVSSSLHLCHVIQYKKVFISSRVNFTPQSCMLLFFCWQTDCSEWTLSAVTYLWMVMKSWLLLWHFRGDEINNGICLDSR